MGLRFQKRIKTLPGVTLNLSRSGISTSIGTTGARVTLGHGQTRTTVGAPGTGISHTQIKSNHQADTPAPPPAEDDARNLVIGITFIAALFGIAWLIHTVF